MRLLKYLSVSLIAFIVPAAAYAHEVYVLPKDMIVHDLTMPSLQVFDIINAHTGQFFFWMFIVAWAFFTILAISLSKPIERHVSPQLNRLKPYAPLVARVTLGLAIIASGYFGAMFGPELPFSDFLSPQIASFLDDILITLGALIALGLFTRLASSVLIIIYLLMWQHYGIYMLTYANYFGEMVVALLIGNSLVALDRYFHHLYPHTIHKHITWLEAHSFLILRVAFGLSLIFASMYAKFLHAQLAIDTVTRYHLTNIFPFDSAFIVLGAFCIELLLGVFFVLGIEVRFASLFLLFWLSLSLWYFGEAVWPHIILAGVAIALFMHGYDKYTVQFGLMRRRYKWMKEPTL
jgi:uncharacterized membrane protein YphA (DoxX/SURF4 family)